MKRPRASFLGRTTLACTDRHSHTLALLAAGLCSLFCAVLGRAQPVDIRVHDPVMIRQDSTYYLFCTGRGIAVWSSRDMRHWERAYL